MIDYSKIKDAYGYYSSKGYGYKEVPWIVDYKSYSVTKPKDAQDFFCLGGYLNASGEQSFIQMIREGVSLDKSFCITPCFRAEKLVDELHQRYFMKVELIDTNVSCQTLLEMINLAKIFLDRYLLPENNECLIQETEKDQYDLIDNKYGIEIGSYGIRVTEDLSFVYGTGLALPRLDTIIEIGKRWQRK